MIDVDVPGLGPGIETAQNRLLQGIKHVEKSRACTCMASLKKEVDVLYAVIETGGKQYRVSTGDAIYVEKLDVNEGDEVILGRVLLVSQDGKTQVGTPYVEGAKVTAKAARQGKQKKIIVFKYKAKKNYRRKQGHRQPYTKLVIESITA